MYSLLTASAPTTLTGLSMHHASGSNENYLMFSVHLPSSAPQSLEGLTDTLTYAFTANQPTAGFIG
jgi:ABC-type proline/glycine betaine transport system permease subunit